MTVLRDININQPISAFDEMLVAQKYPVVQAIASYNTIPANFRTFTASGGSATATGREFVCQTGTSVGGYGVIRSFRSIAFHAGQGAEAIFSARFTTGIANSGQIAGVFNIGDGMFFGYNGTSFGVCHRYGGVPEVQRLTITVGASGATSATVTLDGTAFVIPLSASSIATNAQEIADYLEANTSAWESTANGATVTCVANSDGNKSGSFAFSHATASASWIEVTAGVTKTENWTAKASWNLKPNFSIDPTKGNVFQIMWRYAYGSMDFNILNGTTGNFETVHRIVYPNNYTIPNFNNPSLNIGISAYSLGSTTNLTVASGNVAGFVQGKRPFTRNPRSQNAQRASVGTTATPILSLRNRNELNGTVNKGQIQLLRVSGSTTSNQGAFIELWTAPTTLTAPLWSYTNQSNLISEVDSSATALTGGNLIMTLDVPPTNGGSAPLIDFFIELPPSLVLVISGRVKSGAASTITASLMWYEDVF